METRSGKLIATDESTVIAKSVLDTRVMEDGESDGGFSDPPCTDESNRLEVFGETNDLLDYVVAAKTDPRRRGR